MSAKARLPLCPSSFKHQQILLATVFISLISCPVPAATPQLSLAVHLTCPWVGWALELAGCIYFSCSWLWFSKQTSTCTPLSACSWWLKPLQLGHKFLIANSIPMPFLGCNGEDMLWATAIGTLAVLLPILDPIFEKTPICECLGGGTWFPFLCFLTSAHQSHALCHR